MILLVLFLWFSVMFLFYGSFLLSDYFRSLLFLFLRIMYDLLYMILLAVFIDGIGSG